MVLESLFGSLAGGVFRLVPEFLKIFDRKKEREHELSMLRAEMDFAKVKGELELRKVDAQMAVSELGALTEALKEQGSTAAAAGKFIAGLSASVRPIVTYFFVIVYGLVKFATFQIAVSQGGEWKTVLVSMWTETDAGILSLVLTFWFVGRIFERGRS